MEGIAKWIDIMIMTLIILLLVDIRVEPIHTRLPNEFVKLNINIY